MAKIIRSLEVLSHVLNELNDCINGGNYDLDDDDKFFDYSIHQDDCIFTTVLELFMDYNTTYDNRQWLLNLERYVINNSCECKKEPLSHTYDGRLIETALYKIDGFLKINISWCY